jgi:hypothetical protein
MDEKKTGLFMEPSYGYGYSVGNSYHLYGIKK